MYRIVLACKGVPANVEAVAARDITEESAVDSRLHYRTDGAAARNVALFTNKKAPPVRRGIDLGECRPSYADGSRGLGLIGIDLFAPNDLSLRFFTAGPFNE